MDLKTTLLERLRRCGTHVSFAELISEDMKGDFNWMYPGCKNVVVWFGMKEEVIRALHAIMKEENWNLAPASFLTYLCDGAIPQVPVAKRMCDYAKTHWVPMVFIKGQAA